MTSQNNALELKKAVFSEPKESQGMMKQYSELSKDEKEAVDILKSKFGMSETIALETFFNQEKWLEWKSIQRRKLDVKDLEMAARLQEEVDTKIRSGSLGQAKEGYITLATLRDKVLGQQAKPGPSFIVGGREVKIHVNFPFKPYNKNNPIEKLQEIKTTGEEDGTR